MSFRTCAAGAVFLAAFLAFLPVSTLRAGTHETGTGIPAAAVGEHIDLPDPAFPSVSGQVLPIRDILWLLDIGIAATGTEWAHAALTGTAEAAEPPAETDDLVDRVRPGVREPEPPLLLSVLLFLWDGIDWSVRFEGLPPIDLSLTATTGVEFRFGARTGLALRYSTVAALRGLASILETVL